MRGVFGGNWEVCSSFKERLSKDKYIVDHQRNLQILATGIYEILNGLLSDIMQDISKTKCYYYMILVIGKCFPQELLKQIWITDHLLHDSKNLGPCTQKR